MQAKTACEALTIARRLEIKYDGYIRVVEVHACGLTKEANAVVRVWQVRGGSVSNEPVGWKFLRLDEAVGLAVLSEQSSAPRPGYRRNDKAIARIVCQL